MVTNPGNCPEFDLAAFLASSARGSLEEGVHTASFRMVDAIRRLIDFSPQLQGSPFCVDLEALLQSRFESSYLGHESEYLEFLDELMRRFAAEILRRNDLQVPTADGAADYEAIGETQ